MTRSLCFWVAMMFWLPLSAQQTQTAPQHKPKILTPAQRTYQAAWKQWFTEHEQKRKSTLAILERVPPQPPGGDCQEAMSTYDAVQCLGALDEGITVDEGDFFTALRDLASHEPPIFPGEEPLPGDRSSQARAGLLTALENNWRTYRRSGTNVAQAEGDGGTIRPILALSTDLYLLRSHLGELAEMYGQTLLSSH